MKFLTTKKEMRNSGYQTVKVGYCRMQTLLQAEKAIAYSKRAEGWACDYYIIKDETGRELLVSTGYAPMGKSNEIINGLIEKAEEKARKTDCSDKNFDQRRKEIKQLLTDLATNLFKELEK